MNNYIVIRIFKVGSNSVFDLGNDTIYSMCLCGLKTKCNLCLKAFTIMEMLVVGAKTPMIRSLQLVRKMIGFLSVREGPRNYGIRYHTRKTPPPEHGAVPFLRYPHHFPREGC
jgi:hypothetical protein